MKSFLTGALTALLALSPMASNALELGPEDFLAARSMTCVLAQESLGYLTEDEFSAAAETVMSGYDQAQGDVVYAKAIGYFDGLMFGLQANDPAEINARLQEYLSSSACTRLTGARPAGLSI